MSSPSSPHKAMEVLRPRSSQRQRVSMTWGDEDAAASTTHHRLMQFAEECIETKTVTTTTTTKRSYPPLFVREPRNLHSLDSKEYPLASRPTPPELRKLTFDVGEQNGEPWLYHDDLESQNRRRSHSSDYAGLVKCEPGVDSPLAESFPRPSGMPAAETALRRSQRSSARAASPSYTPLPPRTSQRSARHNQLSRTSDNLHRAVAHSTRKEAERTSRQTSEYLATPDTSEIATGGLDRASRLRPLHLDNAESATSQSTIAYDAASPAGSESQTVFSNVATPPVTDADLQPFGDADESLLQTIRTIHARPSINTVAAQDASLPSPRLSPTLAAAQLQTGPVDEDGAGDDEADFSRQLTRTDRRRWYDESQTTEEGDPEFIRSVDLSPVPFNPASSRPKAGQAHPMDPRSMLEGFDAMPNDYKTWMMYQFLRRCPRKTLHMVADVVNPALKCDFLKQLPVELSLQVLSYLDHRDLCRAAQVSKHWRNIVDSNETGWKELFDRDGFELPQGELQKAIVQGWGWQDPVGVEGCEVDLSLQNRLTSSESELLRSAAKAEKANAVPKIRSAKRKRGLMVNADRSKRRASAQELKDDRSSPVAKMHKSEGPNSAANAAALAVPDPHIGLPSLRKLHLFKSLYRRHLMIRNSWTSGKVKPGHVAFAAHPRHVITCLQFDEDKIITGSDDTLIHVYDTKTGQLRTKLEGHEGGVWALQYEGNTLVSGSTDRSVRVWDIQKGICTQTFFGHTSTVRCLQILMPTDTGKVQDGKPVMMPQKPLIITGSRDSQLRVWRLPAAENRRYIQTGPPSNDDDCPYFIRILSGHTHSVRAISAHGDTLVSGSYDSTVRVWRISTGEQLHVLHGHSQKVYSVVLDHKRNRCISGSMDSLVKIWDLDTGACLYTLEGHSLLVGLLDLRDEKLVSAAADSTLRIWDPETGKCKSTLMAHTGAITCFQHDGNKVISGSEKTVKMWDIHTGECIQDLLSDLSGVWQVKFDQRRCVAAVQRGNLTYVEILDFGAVRDGKPPEELGKRKLLNEAEVQRLLEEEA
ncbi:WD40-repeat-containing domain protein [Podospora appendiculata]|uniref:WD40-repeat-containing domain protein n=1 Tax=Podospora appendiculata TaxID=314037 RepID=A0AAE0XHT6_9PEZI|nr:WD40-repeat-containing domain protein [Podospora appendiculata]